MFPQATRRPPRSRAGPPALWNWFHRAHRLEAERDRLEPVETFPQDIPALEADRLEAERIGTAFYLRKCFLMIRHRLEAERDRLEADRHRPYRRRPNH
jgi:hypothetical protein